jgi:hypothetical protein
MRHLPSEVRGIVRVRPYAKRSPGLRRGTKSHRFTSMSVDIRGKSNDQTIMAKIPLTIFYRFPIKPAPRGKGVAIH